MIFRSLPFKINAAILATGMAISVLFVIILYPLEIRRGEEQIGRIQLLLETVFQQKINDLANELFARQERALKATMKDIMTVDGIVAIRVYDVEGNLFLATMSSADHQHSSDSAAGLPVTGFSMEKSQNADLGIYTNPIKVIGKEIGYIAIYYDLSKIHEESRKAVSIIFVLPIFTVLLMSVLLNFFLFRSIIRPVSTLRNAMREVESGKLGETVLLAGDDEIGEMGSAFNDMSLKMKLSQEALMEAEEKYRSIFENAIEGIFRYSLDSGKMLTVNPSMAAMLGYASPQECLTAFTQGGKHFFVQEADWQHFNSALAQAGRIVGFETELLNKNGATIWVSLSARRVAGGEGDSFYDEGSCIDLTEHRQRMAAEQQREAAESASRAKSDFLAKMSHEIRTPLNAIMGFADILENSVADAKLKNYVQIIQSSGTNLLSLINDILDLSKIEAGRMEIIHSAKNIRELIHELVNLFSISTRDKNIELIATISPEVPLFLMIDGVRLRQVLFNLIGNAIKFTERGSVHIRCSAERGSADNLWHVTLLVEDSGRGIAEDALQQIFDSFHRQDIQGRHIEGTGLGLAITKTLAEMMNGRISVRSSLGHGSVFTIVFRDIHSTTPHDLSAESIPPKRAAAVPFGPARLLVVDDLEINRQHIITALHDLELTVIQADNGKAAVESAEKLQPDLILMDIRMPELNGYQALSRIRQLRKSIPIIAITAAGMKEDIESIGAAGFDGYLIRPFHRSQLVEMIARFLPSSDILRRPGILPLEMQEEKTVQEQAESLRPWQCQPPVAELLQGRLFKRWQIICRKRRIPDIVDFSKQLGLLGSRHGVATLVTYGDTLRGHAENADIDGLLDCLADFKKLLDLMIIEQESTRMVERYADGPHDDN